MATYAGGEHTAELIAIDGAGNAAKKVWTINVDPKGTISASEATDTLEAIDTTTPEVTELSSFSGVVIPSSADPELTSTGGQMSSNGAPAPSTISATVGGGFEVEAYEEEGEADELRGIVVQPMNTNEPGKAPTVVNGTAAVTTNTATATDTIVRPAYDGTMAFQAIRDATAPETYSWKVALEEGMTLKLVDSEDAGVYFEDGTQAMMISAHTAHAADGKAISVTLEVSGNVVTLTVHHHVAGTVYPVVSGAAFEVGYVATVDPNPSGTPDPPNEFRGYLGVSPPEPIDSSETEASASGLKPAKKHFSYVECSHTVAWAEEQAGIDQLPLMEWISGLKWDEECGNPFTNKPGNQTVWRVGIHGKFLIKEGVKVWHEGGPNDSIGCAGDARHDTTQRKLIIDRCVWWGMSPDGGGNFALYGKHITPALRVHGEERSGCAEINNCEGQPNPWVEVNTIPPISVYIWAVGRVNAHETDCIDCD
jgi:hypothetical protein